MKKFLLFIMVFGMSQVYAFAGDYYVSASLSGTDGDIVEYRERSFAIGHTAFKTFADFMAANPEENSTVYVDGGTYSDKLTITTSGLTFLGNNAYCESRSSNRTAAESIITGQWTVNADNVTVNGFQFSGAGSIINESATNVTPMSGFKFVYNIVKNSTLTHAENTAVVKIGTSYREEAANVATAHRRYNGVDISHNAFSGSATYTAHFVIVSGSYGTTNINDNTFSDGGTSVHVSNAQGEININSNKFTNVGDTARVINGTAGEFCIFLNYIAYSNSTTVNIKNNYFSQCHGRSSIYPLIRFFQGDKSNAAMTPVNCHINLNYNVFRKKPKHSSRTYNYVFYGNETYTAPTTVDARYNQFDNSELCLGMIQQPWDDEQSRYFASTYELFDFASSAGTTVDYYKDAAGNQVKAVSLASTRVHQSFDVDTKTGDIYFIQINPNSSSGLSLKAYEPLVVIRYYKNSSGTMSKQYMYLDFAGHGSNMAVANIDGTVWIFTGGNSDDPNTNSSLTETRSRASCIFPFVAGATADLSQTSFTYKSKTYEIKQFVNKYNRNWQYPAIDIESNLFAERTTKNSVVYTAIYDLDDVMTNGSNATALKLITMPKYVDPYTSTATANQGFVEADKGFSTWPGQGFTISGDFLYFLEGVGEGDASAVTYNGAKIPTLMLHVYNWRTDKLQYRKPILKSTIIDLVHGEPEGIKIHRNSKGRANMLLGVSSGGTNARKANIFCYQPEQTTGDSYSIPRGVSTPSVTSLDFTASTFAATANQSFTVANSAKNGGDVSNLNGDLQVTISGIDASCFSFTTSKTTILSKKSTIKVKYIPDGIKKSHEAKLRISSPYASSDVFVTLTGTYSGDVTRVEKIEDVSHEILLQGKTVVVPENACVEVFDIMGNKRLSGIGSQDVSELSAGIYVVRCITDGDAVTTKISLK